MIEQPVVQTGTEVSSTLASLANLQRSLDASTPNLPRVSSFKVIVVLPAYNEQENLPGLLDNLAEALTDASLDFEIVVVDDGSSDATPDILTQRGTQLPLRVQRHERNQGLGGTIRDGLFLR